MTPSTELELSGLDGGNPLAFLAALGALRALSLARHGNALRLIWRQREGTWRPVLRGPELQDAETILDALEDFLQGMRHHPALTFAKDLSVEVPVFREQAGLAQAAASPVDRKQADFIAAFGCEAVTRDERGQDHLIQDTAFRTMSGAGHQHFLGFMNELTLVTERHHLEAALFHEWVYADHAPSLRWDPIDDRRYALRWGDPSNSARSPIRTVRGANRLAIEALPLFPTLPAGGRLETTGFRQPRGEEAAWTWPLWDIPLSLDTLRSVLALAELQAARPDRRWLAARGIAEVYRCQRVTVGKYRNFTAARPA